MPFAIALRNFQFHKRTLPTLPLSPQPRPPCAHMTHHGTLEGSCPVVLQQPKRKTHREKKTQKKTPVRDRSIQQMMVCFFDRFVDWLSCNPHTPSCDPVTISPVGRVATATAWAPLKHHGTTLGPRESWINWSGHASKCLTFQNGSLQLPTKNGGGKVVRFKHMLQKSVKKKKTSWNLIQTTRVFP